MEPFRNSKIIMISGGKGGVGKSTVAAGLVKALAMANYSVALLDADLSGPSQHIFFAEGVIRAENGLLIPAIVDSIQIVSMGYLSQVESAIVWSEDTARSLVKTFINQTKWISPEILVVDLPPSTSPVTRILLEFLEKAYVVFVCTISKLSIADCNRDIAYHRRLETIPFGIIENLSTDYCHQCDYNNQFLSSKGVEEMAHQNGLSILARFPFSNNLHDEPAMKDFLNKITLK